MQAGKNVNHVCYAEDCGGHSFSVFPIWRGDALATLTPEEDDEVEFDAWSDSKSFRVLTMDLFEFYTLMDCNRNVIHTPDDYEN